MVSLLSQSTFVLAYSNTLHVWSPQLAMQILSKTRSFIQCKKKTKPRSTMQLKLLDAVVRIRSELLLSGRCCRDFTVCSRNSRVYTNVVYSPQSSADPDLDYFSEPIMMNVFVSDFVTVVVLALFHFQSGLYAFMLYELVLDCLFACIALVSVFISLRIAFTESRNLCNLYSGANVHYST